MRIKYSPTDPDWLPELLKRKKGILLDVDQYGKAVGQNIAQASMLLNHMKLNIRNWPSLLINPYEESKAEKSGASNAHPPTRIKSRAGVTDFER